MLRCILAESESRGVVTPDLDVARVQADETVALWRLPLKFTHSEIHALIPGRQAGVVVFLHGRRTRDLPVSVDAEDVALSYYTSDLAGDLTDTLLRPGPGTHN